VRNRNRFAEREGTALSATSPGGDYAYIACHRRTKGATRPRPCVSRGWEGRMEERAREARGKEGAKRDVLQ